MARHLLRHTGIPAGKGFLIRNVVCTVSGPRGDSLALVALDDGGWGVTRNGELIPETYRPRGRADEEVGAVFVELARVATGTQALSQ